jgi:hypothetical protein
VNFRFDIHSGCCVGNGILIIIFFGSRFFTTGFLIVAVINFEPRFIDCSLGCLSLNSKDNRISRFYARQVSFRILSPIRIIDLNYDALASNSCSWSNRCSRGSCWGSGWGLSSRWRTLWRITLSIIAYSAISNSVNLFTTASGSRLSGS